MSRDWDARTYDRVSTPQHALGERVLSRLPLDGDETVLDAGCGSGRVTRLLVERLPEGHVIAVDAAPSMVEHARAALGERATVFHADLTELVLEEPVDAAFSNAVFHWVPDHDRLFARLFAALKPGAPLVAQCGGAGNVERFRAAAAAVAAEEPFAEHFAGWRGPWNFQSAEATAERLERSGFEDVRTWLEPYPVEPEDRDGYLRAVCLGYHLLCLPDELHDRFVAAVAERADPVLDYVRLNIDARRPAQARRPSTARGR